MSAETFGIESFTGIRPTADLTVANYLGAIQPILEQEAQGTEASVFLAELHAATTSSPMEIMTHSEQLTRTLMASGVRGEIYSQFQVKDLVAQTEIAIRGLTTVSRLLRLPTLKDKIAQSDKPESASAALLLYPTLMAADIILARPRFVPTGKDQKPHIEITNELIRAFNREYGAQLPEPQPRTAEPINIASLDQSGRKMSKSIPKGAIFLDDTEAAARKKIMQAPTASQPGAQMNRAVDNLTAIAEGLTTDTDQIKLIYELGNSTKDGARTTKEFKLEVADVVVAFLEDLDEKRSSISAQAVKERLARGNEWFRPIGTTTLSYIDLKQWGVQS